MATMSTTKFKTIDQYIFAFPSKVKTSNETSKGTVKFPFEKPIPVSLVKKIVKYRVN
jgi:uncharacterized protein YdhG (YjbR/CyaY superfamily)